MIQPFHSWEFTQEQRKHVSAKIYTQLFVAALFIITHTGNNLNATSRWMGKHCASVQRGSKQQKLQNTDAKQS